MSYGRESFLFKLTIGFDKINLFIFLKYVACIKNSEVVLVQKEINGILEA